MPYITKPYILLGLGSSFRVLTYEIDDKRTLHVRSLTGKLAVIPLENAIARREDHANFLTKLFRRIFDMGDVLVAAQGGEHLCKKVRGVQAFIAAINGAHPSVSSETDTAQATNVQVVKAVPLSTSELERVQSDFKFFSPVQKSYKSASLPKQGEVWKLERTLPSGLHLGIKRPGESFLKEEIRQIKEDMHRKFFDKEEDDLRLYQYDVERYKREEPLHSIQMNNTHSVSWHPTKMVLVTDGAVCKLWNVETGDLITKRPWPHTHHAGYTICWSPDGELFAGEQYIFDGSTGKDLRIGQDKKFIPGPGDRYSTNLYTDLRGIGDYRDRAIQQTTSHLSSSNNFSSWRPNSSQYVISDWQATSEWAYNPWNPSSTQYGRNLVFRNGRTGEIEKVIDCDVVSEISDFAWHPKGRFIAVAFKEHCVRIIDIDEAKIVDDLSIQFLIGWSPDGKILVARKEKEKNEFVIWDALEIEEKAMPEKMRNELWLKRFFLNISADGLRYIKIEEREGMIYSVASDDLVATLPKQVSSAAWSPIDGGLLATCGGSETHLWKL